MITRFKLWQLSRRARPDAVFVARLETVLREQGAWSAPRVSPLAVRFAAGACVVVLALGGTASYAYASDSVLPDHPLYGLREAVESMEERAMLDPEAQAAVQRKLVERRLHEITLMRNRRLALGPLVITRLRDSMLRLEATSTAEGVVAIDAWKALLQRRQRTLDKREAARLEKEADEKFTQIQDRLKQLQEKAQKLRPGSLRRK